jgi:hypothetical protein
MPERKVASNKKTKSKRDRAKEVVKNYWKPFTVGAAFTVATTIVAKRVGLRLRYTHVEGTSVFIHKVALKEGPLYNVFNIYAQGFKNRGPSWMIKCKETGVLFRSQEHAATVMGLSKTHISHQVRGLRHSVGGYHFERIGIAA